MATMINLDELLFRAYSLGLLAEKGVAAMTAVELRNSLMQSVQIGAVQQSKIEKAEKVEKVEKVRAPSKPRAVPEDDTRCCTRTLDDKLHLEGGKLKVMRDDETNQYGDRCKFKKADGTDFCKHHAEKQPLGVWGGEYAGRFKQYVEKVETVASSVSSVQVIPAASSASWVSSAAAAETPAKKTIKKSAPAAPAPAPKKAPVVDDDSDEDVSEEDMMDKLEAAGIEYEWIEIEDENFMIDAQNNVYDPENEKKCGVYDRKQKKWISGGLPKH